MPIFSYFAAVGSVLVALLFMADATMQKGTTPIVATSNLTGLPKPWHLEPVQNLAAAPAPAPDMTSAAVLSAMARTEPESKPVNARSVAAEPAPRKKRVAHKQVPVEDARQSFAWSPNTRGPSGGGFFGRL